METPVLLVGKNVNVDVSGVRVVRSDAVLPRSAYLVDGETFCVNGEYPFRCCAS